MGRREVFSLLKCRIVIDLIALCHIPTLGQGIRPLVTNHSYHVGWHESEAAARLHATVGST